jgi:hypothetical protein
MRTNQKGITLSITRFAAGTIVASAAVLTFGASPALAEIPLQPATSAPDVQAPQPISSLPGTGSTGTGSGTDCGVPAGLHC